MDTFAQDAIKKTESSFAQHEALLAECRRFLPPLIATIGQAMRDTLKAGGKIMFCGNGGSAADAQHIAAELVGRFKKDRRALAGIALTTDTSILTCVGNDYSFDDIFARQVAALARPGDMLFGISTSGNSPNVLKAVEEANRLGCVTVALAGRDGGKIAPLCRHAIVIPSPDTARIQEMHIMAGHMLCDLLEDF